MARKKASPKSGVLASLSLLNKSKNTLASEQVELLEAIDGEGSITGAARIVGISYKTAWEKVETLNNTSKKPLVTRVTGGAKGGGTQLTDFGRRIVQGFRAMETEHAAYLERLGNKVKSLNDIANFVEVGTMRTTARNQFRGTVKRLTPGAVNAEVQLAISENLTINLIITEESCRQLGITVGVSAIALVKSSSVMLSKDVEVAVSARNRLKGVISRVTEGAVNTDVVVDIGDSKSISAMVTRGSVEELALKLGDPVCAFFKASSVILLVE